ncbi:MAG: ion transporter [Alphaproteobacteria bacterium]|nr:ion transporter [Alphaproteobacteria bacterium]
MSEGITLRRLADRFIHHRVVEYVLLALISASVALLVLELFVVDGVVKEICVAAGDALTVVFWFELAVRFWVARTKRRFFARYWVDILSVLPLARPLRVFRVLRILRLFRAGVLLSRRIGAFRGGIGSSMNDLIALALGSVVLVLAAAMVLNAGEGATNPAFRDFDDALWFAMLSVVGGEPIGGEPQTELGRWTTLGLMIGGLTIFGMFIGTVSAGMVARFRDGMGVSRMDVDELDQHIVVFGWNDAGPALLRELFGPGSDVGGGVVLVTEQGPLPSTVPLDDIDPDLFLHHVGDYVRIDVLEQLQMKHAKTAILLTDHLVRRSAADRDARTVAAALTIERMAPGLFTVAQLTNPQHSDILRMAGVEEIVVGDWFAGMIIGSATRNRGLVAVLDEILTSKRGNSFFSVRAPASWDGRPVSELLPVLHAQHRAVLISVGGDVNPGPEHVVRTGEVIVVLAKVPPKLA